ncbi:MAG: ATP-binding cassette domain-containing protein [Desulfohalobiaceae bacterium]|nr:ATP-binding cassette domain-containing protein [Desulfohalobiaceae bacterium]
MHESGAGSNRTASRTDKATTSGSSMPMVQAMTRRVIVSTLFFSLITNILGLAGLAAMLTYLRFVIPSQDVGNIPVVAAAGAGALVAYALFEVIRSHLMIRHGTLVQQALSDEVFAGMLQDAAEQRDRGFTRGMADLRMVRSFVSSPQVFVFFDCLIAPIFLLGILYLSPILAACVLAAMGFIVLITLKIRKETKAAFAATGKSSNENKQLLEEGLRCQEAVRAMGMERTLEKQWRQGREQVLIQESQASDRISGWTALSKFISVAVPVLIVTIAAWLIINNYMTGVMGLIVAKVLSMRAISPVHGVVSGWDRFQAAKTAYDSLRDLLGEGGEQPGEKLSLPTPKGALKAEQISYSIKGQTLVRSLSLELEAGEFLGIYGPMAAGKTTLALLLCGVLQPVMGKVRLDGADMFHWEQDLLGLHIGYLPQDAELFPGSLAENIARLEEPDKLEVEQACRLAGLGPALERIPQGLQTQIEKNGARLPGGLRQKVGLARALYGSPCLVVLDEPDANLDPAGVEDLRNTLEELKARGTTVVLITHRPDLLETADKLLFMREGRMVQYGPRKEVMAKMAAAAKKGPLTVRL